MEKAIKAYFDNQPLAAWPYIVGVKDDKATLYHNGELVGVTHDGWKYMLVSTAADLGLETEYYNEEWCKIINATNEGMTMKVKIENLAFCPDCTMVAVNGDYTGLDYHYSADEAEKREQEINAGLAALGGPVYYDSSKDADEFSSRRCDCCGSNLAGQRDYFIILGD